MKRITSRQNQIVAHYRSVARGQEPGRLLLDGPHLVREALDAGVVIRHVLVENSAAGRDGIGALVADLQQRGVDVAAATAPVMGAVSPVRSPSQIVGVADRPRDSPARLYGGRNPLVVVACDVQDPGNVGAIVRVSEAGHASGLVAAGRSADPFGWKALRGSMGSAFRLPTVVARDTDGAIAQAREHGCRVVASVPRGGRGLFEIDLRGPAAVLIGGEGSGLAPSVVRAADEQLTIPMRPPVESMNAATAAALIVYEALRQRTD
jgi:TrmH family RNA methyltransferase